VPRLPRFGASLGLCIPLRSVAAPGGLPACAFSPHARQAERPPDNRSLPATIISSFRTEGSADSHRNARVKPLDRKPPRGEGYGVKTPHALVAGCGYLGEAVADLLHGAGWTVTGWTASSASANRLASCKPYPVQANDIADRDALVAAANRLEPPTVLIDCVSSGRGGADQYRRVYLQGALHLLEAFPAARLIFTGSTSVYAQTDGSWVDETSLAGPTRETGVILLETEALVLAAGGIVARLSGIYGPGRAGLLEKFLAGNAVVEGDGGRWLNHIHRDDAASALATLANLALCGDAGGIYNVSDSRPMTQLDLYRGLADHFGRPLPPSGPIDLNRKRGWTSKRVSHEQLSKHGWRPSFPSYLDWAKSVAETPRP
jgi:nucleoside-diphosphate-sugar epimerase